MSPSPLLLGSLLAVIAGITTVIGNMLAKEWALQKGTVFLVLTLLFYAMGSLIFPFAVRQGTLSTVSILSGLTAVTATTLIGMFWYREHMTMLQLVGLAFGVVAIVLLTFSRRTAF